MELHQMSVQKLTEKLEKAERELAVAVIENADLRERLSSLESLYRARDKDCAAKEAELERLRALPSKWREDGEKEEGDGEMGAAIACWCCANELEAALASPAAGITGTEQCVDGGTCGAGGFCDECEISPDSRQLAIEGQHPCCWAPSKALKELERGMNNAPCILTDSPTELNDTPLYAHPQPSPDVGALVEALDMTELRKLLLILRGKIGGAMWTLDEEEKELAVRTEKAIDAIEVLAAYRKGGRP